MKLTPIVVRVSISSMDGVELEKFVVTDRLALMPDADEAVERRCLARDISEAVGQYAQFLGMEIEAL